MQNEFKDDSTVKDHDLQGQEEPWLMDFPAYEEACGATAETAKGLAILQY